MPIGSSPTPPTGAWEALRTYILSELAYEGNTITDDTILEYANQAVDIISEVVRPLPYTVKVSDLQQQSGAYVLPSDLVGPLVVSRDGFILPVVPREDYQRRVEGTLTEGLGGEVCHISGLRFYTTSDSPENIVIHGAQALPYYTATGLSPDPMAALPRRFNKLPAHYVLANYRAGADVAPEVARVQRHTALWQDGLAAAVAAVRGLQSEEYRF